MPIEKSKQLNAQDFYWLYFALGYTCGAVSKEKDDAQSKALFQRVIQIKEKLEALQDDYAQQTI